MCKMCHALRAMTTAATRHLLGAPAHQSNTFQDRKELTGAAGFPRIMVFDSLESLGRVFIAGLCGYAALILVLRIAGKRSLAKLNAFDLVVTVAFGSTLATVLLSKDVPLADGVLAFVVLAGLQYGVSKASVLWPAVNRLVRSSPRLLVEDGTYREEAMAGERVTRSEVDAAIRKHGIGTIEDVSAVVLETDGEFSVIRKCDAGALSVLHSVQR